MSKSPTKQAEFRINIKNTPEKYVDYLILGLVRSGHDAYLTYDNEDVAFTGWLDDIVTEIKGE